METEGLLAVCAGLGHVPQDESGNHTGKFFKGENCLDNLKDLQRFLRRDNPQTRDAFKQICRWNVVSTSLIPIIVHYREEAELVMNSVKVIVFLTMPIDSSSDDAPLQLDYLWGIKTSFTWNDAVAVIVSFLEEPLEHLESDLFTEDDWKIVELVLTLFRNLLAIKDPSPQQMSEQSLSQFVFSRDSFLEHLFHENVMDLILALTQHVAGSHGLLRKSNLLFLEIFHYIYSGQKPELVQKPNLASSGHYPGPQKKMPESSGLPKGKVEEKIRLLRIKDSPRHSRFCGTFVRQTLDGSKKIVKRNPFITPTEAVFKGNQIKRGPTKRIACDTNSPMSSSEGVLGLLQSFTEHFLSSGYNVLMQSVREDIKRDHHAIQNSDVIVFFEVAQFFTAFQRYRVKEKKGELKKSNNSESNNHDSQTFFQGHICGPVASTMNETMFNMVVSKWHDTFEALKETHDIKTLTTAGALLKEMVHMLDLVLRLSRDGIKEIEQEARTARILLYKLFYDQTEKGISRLLLTLTKSFDIHKQPRSFLADLVEMTHIVLHLMENLKETDGTLRVLKKSRKGKKKKTVDANKADKGSKDSQTAGDTSDHSVKEKLDMDAQKLDGSNQSNDNEQEEEMLDIDGLPNSSDNVDKNGVEEGLEEECHGNKLEDAEGDSEEDKHVTKREADLDIRNFLLSFADNTVVRNYCWLLRFYKSNSNVTNHYLVRMLQRLCDDCMVSPMLYQLSLFSIFYEILSDPETLESKEYESIVKFLTRLLRSFFKKVKDQPFLLLEILFWKTRRECYSIHTYQMLSDMKKLKSNSSLLKKRSLSDALGEDEVNEYTQLEPVNETCRRSLADVLGEDEADLVSNNVDYSEKRGVSSHTVSAKKRKSILFSDEQKEQIKELFESYKDNKRCSHIIAEALDANGKFSAAQISRKLRLLGLKATSKEKGSSMLDGLDEEDELLEEDSEGGALERPMAVPNLRRPFRKRQILDSEDEAEDFTPPKEQDSENAKSSAKSDKIKSSKKKISISEEQECLLKELFEQNKEDKNCSNLIAETLGLSKSQVSYFLKLLGLKKTSRKSETGVENNSEKVISLEEDEDAITNLSNDKEGHTKKKKRLHLSEAQERQLNELYEQYKENKRSSHLIAEEINMSVAQVNYNLKKLGLKAVSKKQKHEASKPSVESDNSDNETLKDKLARVQKKEVKEHAKLDEDDENESENEALMFKFPRKHRMKENKSEDAKNLIGSQKDSIDSQQTDKISENMLTEIDDGNDSDDEILIKNFKISQASNTEMIKMAWNQHKSPANNLEDSQNLLSDGIKKAAVTRDDDDDSDDEILMVKLEKNKERKSSERKSKKSAQAQTIENDDSDDTPLITRIQNTANDSDDELLMAKLKKNKERKSSKQKSKESAQALTFEGANTDDIPLSTRINNAASANNSDSSDDELLVVKLMKNKEKKSNERNNESTQTLRFSDDTPLTTELPNVSVAQEEKNAVSNISEDEVQVAGQEDENVMAEETMVKKGTLA